MGRSSFETHSKPTCGLFDELLGQGHTIIKVEMKNGRFETSLKDHRAPFARIRILIIKNVKVVAHLERILMTN